MLQSRIHHNAKLIIPHVDVNLKEYDLSIINRDKTDNSVTYDALQAIKTH